MNLLTNFAPISKLTDDDRKVVENLCFNYGPGLNVSYVVDSPNKFVPADIDVLNVLKYKTYDEYDNVKGKYDLITQIYNVPVYEVNSASETEEIVALHQKLVESLFDLDVPDDLDYHKFVQEKSLHKFYIAGLPEGENKHGVNLFEHYTGLLFKGFNHTNYVQPISLILDNN